MSTKQTEALKLALEALEGAEALLLSMGLTHLIVYGDAEKAITALREALAEQKSGIKQVIELYDSPDQPSQQEPVAWICEGSSSDEKHAIDYWPGDIEDIPIGTKLYASPPAQRTWVGLTDEEVMVAAYQAGFDIHEDYENEDDPEAMHWWTPDGEACDDSLLKLRDLIEAKLKEKNT